MRPLGSLLALLGLAVLPVFAQDAGEAGAARITDLDALLRAVREQQQERGALNRQREDRFLRERQQQQAQLERLRAEIEQRRRANDPLVAATEANSAQIAALRQQLEAVSTDTGDLAAVFRQFAGDFSAVLQGSLVSAAHPQRHAQLQALAELSAQPAIDDIERLWLLLQEEMTATAKVAAFSAPVVDVSGAARDSEVWRVGPFTAFSEGRFLRYVPETRELLTLSRQPGYRFRRALGEFEDAAAGTLAPVVIDPTRGSLVGMLGSSPGLRERVEQGGIVAVIIIALGTLGLGIAAWRGFSLWRVHRRIAAQLGEVDAPQAGNPLGRVLLAARAVDPRDEELLQLRLDEAVLAEMPALERGIGLIKLLAATSPLLGLLGTVTGMILTFQAISLFGTGDPKLMAGGISQALVTTVLGLVVAIPLLFCHSLVAHLSRSLIQRLDEQCAGVLARAAEGGGRGDG